MPAVWEPSAAVVPGTGAFSRLSGSALRGLRHAAARHSLRDNSATAGPPGPGAAREFGLSRTQLPTLRPRIQAQLNAPAPTAMRAGPAFEADARDPNAGAKPPPASGAHRPPRRRAHTRRGPGTYANDRPPSRRMIARETGEPRFGGWDHAETRPWQRLMAAKVAPGRPQRYPDEWQRDRGSHPCHAPVRPRVREWARDEDGEGRRAVHGHPGEGAGAARRTYLRAFRGVHTPDLHLYGATYAALVKTTHVTPPLLRRMGVVDLSGHTGYT
jgi:hypothetical protein